MTLHPVKSSNLSAIGYDPANRELQVQFKSGGTYSYAGVTSAQHAGLVGAKSVGSHFARHILGRFDGKPVAK